VLEKFDEVRAAHCLRVHLLGRGSFRCLRETDPLLATAPICCSADAGPRGGGLPRGNRLTGRWTELTGRMSCGPQPYFLSGCDSDHWATRKRWESYARKCEVSK
jgi:hypothetical protein